MKGVHLNHIMTNLHSITILIAILIAIPLQFRLPLCYHSDCHSITIPIAISFKFLFPFWLPFCSLLHSLICRCYSSPSPTCRVLLTVMKYHGIINLKKELISTLSLNEILDSDIIFVEVKNSRIIKVLVSSYAACKVPYGYLEYYIYSQMM